MKMANVKGKDRFGQTTAENFVDDQKSKKTIESTKFAVKILREFCVDRGIATDFENYGIGNLADLLKDFYSNIRSQKGDVYSKSTLCLVRQGLRRYLTDPPHKRSFDIITDPRFKQSNIAFNSMLKLARQEGKGQVVHKKPIPEDDLRRLSTL